MDKTPSVLPDEEGELLALLIDESKQHYLYPKFKQFEKYFYDKDNEETYGNATLSYCRAFNLDPADVKAYRVAGVLGHRLLKRVKNYKRQWWETRGLTAGKVLDLYSSFMAERKDVNMLYSISEVFDIELPEYKSIVTAKQGIQQNTQINANDVQITFSALEK